MDTYHLTFTAGRWVLAREGDAGAVAEYTTRAEAELHTGEFLKQRGGIVKVHKPDGSIEEERTIPRGGDPMTPREGNDLPREVEELSMPGLRPYTFEP